jgi:hypothetical protein
MVESIRRIQLAGKRIELSISVSIVSLKSRAHA